MAQTSKENELIEKCRHGDTDAFERLVDLFESDVYNMAFRFMGNHHDACDISQEAFIRVFKGIRGFRGRSSFKTWLYRIVANLCYDELRQKRRRRTSSTERLDGTNIYDDMPDGKPLPEEHMESLEVQELIQKALEVLSEEHRMMVILKDIQGLSYNEISNILDIPMGTVKSRLSRARAELRVYLSEHVRGVKSEL